MTLNCGPVDKPQQVGHVYHWDGRIQLCVGLRKGEADWHRVHVPPHRVAHALSNHGDSPCIDERMEAGVCNMRNNGHSGRPDLCPKGHTKGDTQFRRSQSEHPHYTSYQGVAQGDPDAWPIPADEALYSFAT